MACFEAQIWGRRWRGRNCTSMLLPLQVKEMVEEDLLLARRDAHAEGGGFRVYESEAARN